MDLRARAETSSNPDIGTLATAVFLPKIHTKGRNLDMDQSSGLGDIEWSKDVPGAKANNTPIVSPRPHQKLVCLITSEQWEGVYTHFVDGRTKPCTGSEIDCDGCFKRLARRWKAYLCGILIPQGRRVIIELTQGAMESCPGLIEAGRTLRGRKITLWRRNDAKNAPVHCRLDDVPPTMFLPEAFDLRAALCRVWGFADPGDQLKGGVFQEDQ